MKTATGLQISTLMKGVMRAAGWALVTMAAGLILVLLFGSPLETSSRSYDLPGSSPKMKSGPWGSTPIRVRV